MTNFHVIRGASNIKVALIDSSVYPARVRPTLLLTLARRSRLETAIWRQLLQTLDPINPTPLWCVGAAGSI